MFSFWGLIKLDLVSSNYWRLAPGGEPIMHANDWRSELQPHVRKGVVQQIMNAVKLLLWQQARSVRLFSEHNFKGGFNCSKGVRREGEGARRDA
ncbi:hypothetical protein K1719_012160 [Acacia pycnantha]|nr:hypothetical protein K1719_012160 [Acacia pycnantha]